MVEDQVAARSVVRDPVDVGTLDQRQKRSAAERDLPGTGLAPGCELARLQALRLDPVTVAVEGKNLHHRPATINEGKLMLRAT